MALVGHCGQSVQRAGLPDAGRQVQTRIRIYADTTESNDPQVYAQRMKERKEVMGLTWLKMDLGVEMPWRKARHRHHALRPEPLEK